MITRIPIPIRSNYKITWRIIYSSSSDISRYWSWWLSNSINIKCYNSSVAHKSNMSPCVLRNNSRSPTSVIWISNIGSEIYFSVIYIHSCICCIISCSWSLSEKGLIHCCVFWIYPHINSKITHSIIPVSMIWKC